EWIAEFAAERPDRLKPVLVLSLDDVEHACRELETARRRGFVGCMIAIHPGEDRLYYQPQYDPFWARAAAEGLPVSLHLSATRPRRAGARTMASFVADPVWIVQSTLGELLFGGVFD